MSNQSSQRPEPRSYPSAGVKLEVEHPRLRDLQIRAVFAFVLFVLGGACSLSIADTLGYEWGMTDARWIMPAVMSTWAGSIIYSTDRFVGVRPLMYLVCTLGFTVLGELLAR